MNISVCSPVSTQITGLPESLLRLISLLQNYRYRATPDVIKHCVAQAKVQQEDLLPWATFDHPVTDSYGRKLVYDGGFFQILVMSWLPGDFSAIHDHGSTEWGAVQCFGEALHLAFDLQGWTLSTREISPFGPHQINTVDHDLIHQMGNSGPTRFLSLHVYGRPLPTESMTDNERLFDLSEGAIQFTNGGVFFCLPEDQIVARQLGLQADLETTLRHHRHMQARIDRVLSMGLAVPAVWHQKSMNLAVQIESLLNLVPSAW